MAVFSTSPVCSNWKYGKWDARSVWQIHTEAGTIRIRGTSLEIQSAIGNGQKIQFGYKKPSAKTYMTRVVGPERLLNIPNSRDSGETLCVEGFCELRQDTRVFALERMQALEVIDD